MQILKLHKHSQLVQVGNVKLFPIKLKYVCSLYMLKKNKDRSRQRRKGVGNRKVLQKQS